MSIHLFFILILILIVVCINASGVQSSSRQNHHPHPSESPRPTHYFVLGDRYSGVNYISNVLRNHTKKMESSSTPHTRTNPLLLDANAHIHEHVPKQIQIPIQIPMEECQIRGHDDDYDYEYTYDESVSVSHMMDQDHWKYGFLTVTQLRQNLDCNIDDTLFIMVTKDPYAWLTSLARRYYKNENDDDDVKAINVQSLVMNKYDVDHEEVLGLMNTHTHTRSRSRTNARTRSNNSDKNRQKGLPIRSVIDLRTKKLKKMYSTVSRMKHFAILR